jgi:DNA invertase Pin-like site-specific DNA recombinase
VTGSGGSSWQEALERSRRRAERVERARRAKAVQGHEGDGLGQETAGESTPDLSVEAGARTRDARSGDSVESTPDAIPDTLVGIPLERLVYNRPVERVIGYIRVSTQEQVDSGASLDAQRRRIEGECERRGWELVRIEADEGISATALKKRTAYADALASLKKGDADALMAVRVDRLCRSVFDFADLLQRAAKQKWQVVVLDGGFDTTTPYGKAFAQVAAVFAELERNLISERTKEGLGEKRVQGVRLGRPTLVAPDVIERIETLRSSGSTYRAIADALNDDQVPTAQGGARWWPATVKKVLERVNA